MDHPTNEDNGTSLGVGMARAQGEAAAISASLKWLSAWQTSRLDDDADDVSTPHRPRWPRVRDALGRAGNRSGAAAAQVASGIERHPVLGGLAAFGLGLALSRVLFRPTAKSPPA